MERRNDAWHDMLSALQNANSILLCTHISPDGDAIGSTLAMGRGLRKLGKQVTMACGDPVPELFLFLPGAKDMVTPEQLRDRQFDAALALDAADLARVGECGEAFLSAPVTAQIDHHPDNPCYARYNVVDGKAAAAGCLVYKALLGLGLTVDQEMAMCLYCAISTDTGNFRFRNTDGEAFAIMAELMKTGFQLPEAARPLHQLREEANVRLLGRAIDSLRIFGGGKCAAMALRPQDFRAANAKPEHNTGIVNYALDIPGVEIAYLAEQRENGQVKASLRSLPPWSVGEIARKYGGGGHDQAAGMQYPGSLDEMCAALDGEMLQMLGEKP